ncbi:MAG: hypothetical protein KDJ39_18870 [Gammaproteobacteria bacterium]|nr:hypothetical protein [Gammaproteobacteria bacterium]
MIKSKPLYGEVIGEVRSGRVIFSDQFMRFLDEIIDQYGFIPWDNLNFTGSNLTDIETRLHNDLQAIGGADDTDTDDEQVQHISNLQAKTWTDNDAKQVDVTDTDAVRDKHVSNALGKLWTDTASDLLGHTADTSAHGVTGDNVGTQDFATLGTGGVVLLAAPVADADASTVSVDADSINSAPPVYDQAWGADVQTLANECKTDINDLVGDVNAIRDQLNALMDSLRDSGALGV